MANMQVHAPYEELLDDILRNGTFRGDRTGTGTLSVFGRSMRWDLSEGFPLITTKKVAWKAVRGELLWFLHGDTNIKWLQDNNIHIWDEWAAEDGSLGPVYGSQWRHCPSYNSKELVEIPVRKDEYADFVHDEPHNLEGSTVGFVGTLDREKYHRIFTLWSNMMHNFYGNELSFHSDIHGGESVSPVWWSFDRFVDTVTSLPGYSQWCVDDSMMLTPHYYGSDVFSPSTCVFLKKKDAHNTTVFEDTAVKINGELYPSVDAYFGDIYDSTFAHENWEKGKPYKGVHLDDVQTIPVKDGHVWRYRMYIDQISDVVEQLKNNPESRRMIVNSWNVSELENMALPPCHMTFQFYVADGKLSCHLYQRSADMFLGVPFNIASYSLLTHMIAQQVGLDIGEFVWTGGDCHIYSNHVEQVKEQLGREPRQYPELKLRKKDSLFDYEIGDAQVEGYDPHPPIKAPVAV